MIGLALPAFAGRVWTLLKSIPPLWLAIALLSGLSAFLWHNASGWKAKAQACEIGRRDDRAAYVRAQEEATLIATEAKSRAEARNAQIQKEKDDEIAMAHDANRAYAAQWLRDQGARRSASTADLSFPTAAAGKADAIPAEAIVSGADVLKCADAFTIAEGWQSWWSSISQEPR